MRTHKRALSLILVAFGVTAVAMALRPQSPNAPPLDKQKKFDKSEYESQFPIVDYTAPEPTDPEEIKRRRAVGKKHNKAEIPVGESSGEIFSISHWETGLPALPIDQSQVVMMGRVLDAQAHLSDDKTAVYSEFKILVEGVHKNDGHEPLAAGDSLIAERSGGRVRFPSGRITLQHVAGQGMPRVGRSYLLFLMRADPEQNYQILTGYEVNSGRVNLLDNPGGGTHPIAKYKEVNLSLLLNDLRSALAKSSQGIQPK